MKFDEGFSLPLIAGLTNKTTVCGQHSGRSYHNISHLQHLWDELQKLNPVSQPSVLFLATIFHDWEMGPRAEEKSLQALLKLKPALTKPEIALLQDLILSTRHSIYVPSANTHPDVLKFKDADLAILASVPDRYTSYIKEVRQEYRHLSHAAWTKGRGDFIKTLLAKEKLFLSPAGYEMWEEKARANLAQEAKSYA